MKTWAIVTGAALAVGAVTLSVGGLAYSANHQSHQHEACEAVVEAYQGAEQDLHDISTAAADTLGKIIAGNPNLNRELDRIEEVTDNVADRQDWAEESVELCLGK